MASPIAINGPITGVIMTSATTYSECSSGTANATLSVVSGFITTGQTANQPIALSDYGTGTMVSSTVFYEQSPGLYLVSIEINGVYSLTEATNCTSGTTTWTTVLKFANSVGVTSTYNTSSFVLNGNDCSSGTTQTTIITAPNGQMISGLSAQYVGTFNLQLTQVQYSAMPSSSTFAASMSPSSSPSASPSSSPSPSPSLPPTSDSGVVLVVLLVVLVVAAIAGGTYFYMYQSKSPASKRAFGVQSVEHQAKVHSLKGTIVTGAKPDKVTV
jgi:hypothetical protein